jgi:hypothetical protein
MTLQSYFGLEREDGNSWVLVQCLEGNVILLQRFRDTVDGLHSLEKRMQDHSGRPRICINLSNDSAFKLVQHLGTIPGVEVVLVSEAGLRHHQTGLPKPRANSSSANTLHAEMLA